MTQDLAAHLFTVPDDRQAATSAMTVAKAIESRRSIRAFTDEPLSLETITHVMEQGR